MSIIMDTEIELPVVEIGPRNHQADCQFRVGKERDGQAPICFRVCSRALARASPVFERMLYGNFAERKPIKPDEDWIVDLPEDKPSSFKLFATISHCYLQQVPRSLSLDQLYDLTMLTHIYNATHILVPWCQGWVSSVRDKHLESIYDMPKLLWVSWELGDMDLFETTARQIIMECPGQMFETGSPLNGLPLPLDMIGQMKDIRTQTIDSMLGIFREFADLLTVVDEGPRWCRHASYMGPHRCESMILGSMTFCMKRGALWPIPEGADVNESLLSVYKTLTNLVIHDIGQAAGVDDDHSVCNPHDYLIGKVNDILAGMAQLMLESYEKNIPLETGSPYS
ncbi:hypothetical protein F4859DRAFT_203057 [Xylaria cf. heliscus]|nr:hypothetical protein F4859DRAFT_203057 [Xylaria cf. heliscus]